MVILIRHRSPFGQRTNPNTPIYQLQSNGSWLHPIISSPAAYVRLICSAQAFPLESGNVPNICSYSILFHFLLVTEKTSSLLQIHQTLKSWTQSRLQTDSVQEHLFLLFTNKPKNYIFYFQHVIFGLSQQRNQRVHMG